MSDKNSLPGKLELKKRYLSVIYLLGESSDLYKFYFSPEVDYKENLRISIEELKLSRIYKATGNLCID